MYSKKTMNLFQNLKHQGEIKNPDGIGKVGNPICGDIMHIYIKVKDGIITKCKYKTFGCVAAIANSELMSRIVVGMPLEKAEKLTKDDMLKHLGEMPKEKIHCSMLATDGLKKAIEDYKNKRKN